MSAVIKIQILKDGKLLLLTEYGGGQMILERHEGFPLENDDLLIAALDIIKGALGEKNYGKSDYSYDTSVCKG